MALRLLIVRHGMTQWNLENRYQGFSDPSLNHWGEQQAFRLAELLAGEEIAALYTSDLLRAWQTAKTIEGRIAKSLFVDPRLREMNFGRWEGKTFDEVRSEEPQLLSAWLSQPQSSTPPEGERFSHLTRRVRSVFAELCELYPEGRIAIVTHAGPMGILICQALHRDLSRFRHFKVDLGSISELLITDGRARLLRFNQTDHPRFLPDREGAQHCA